MQKYIVILIALIFTLSACTIEKNYYGDESSAEALTQDTGSETPELSIEESGLSSEESAGTEQGLPEETIDEEDYLIHEVVSRDEFQPKNAATKEFFCGSGKYFEVQFTVEISPNGTVELVGRSKDSWYSVEYPTCYFQEEFSNIGYQTSGVAWEVDSLNTVPGVNGATVRINGLNKALNATTSGRTYYRFLNHVDVFDPSVSEVNISQEGYLRIDITLQGRNKVAELYFYGWLQ